MIFGDQPVKFGYGFDSIIGHHSHIIQPPSLIKSKLLYFSLGNFVSDYWQYRFRKSTIMEYNFDDPRLLKEKICFIKPDGTPKIVGKVEKYLNENKSLSPINNFLINIERLRVRFEYLYITMINCYKIRGKRAFLKWLLSRIT